MRGRKPNQPLKFLSGNTDVKQTAAILGEPEMPEWLSPTARSIWKEIIPQLMQLGILTRVDAAPLARMCWMQATLRDAAEGDLLTVDMVRSLTSAILAIERDFGMTPAARSRVAVKPHLAKVTRADDKSRFFA